MVESFSPLQNPRNPLQPGTVENLNTDLGLLRLTNPNQLRLTKPGLTQPESIRFTNPDPNAPLTFGSLQDMINKQRLLSHQQRLKEINRGPAAQGIFYFQIYI